MLLCIVDCNLLSEELVGSDDAHEELIGTTSPGYVFVFGYIDLNNFIL